MDAAGLPVSPEGAPTRLIRAVRPADLAARLASLPPAGAEFARQSGFGARPHEIVLLPGEGGIEGALLGLGDDDGPFAFGDLAFGLPEGDWRIDPGDLTIAQAVLGFCLGAYRYTAFRPPKRSPARLSVPAECRRALSEAAAIWMARDLVNAPANVLGPAELAAAAFALAQRHGATYHCVDGARLHASYPTIAAVGRGSVRAPVVATLRWQGTGADAHSPLVALCGKGVCFDSGGYDLKPSAGMVRMKKDMGGAAAVLGVARIVMEADLPVRLSVRIGCVENSVSGAAMRPLDVLRTRSGRTVEVGNTDAEGRLVLCDLLTEACDESPDLLVDFATLTGAARVALGPDVPALFCNDEATAAAFLNAGGSVHDPLWRLPLWSGYDRWLDSTVADLNNVSSKPFAGAIVAALFLRRFVPAGTKWAHLDVYAWNDATRPGRPEGGEAQGVRAVVAAIEANISSATDSRRHLVTSGGAS